MADWSMFDVKTLKSMIRQLDNKIEYRRERIEKDENAIAGMEGTRKELADALNALDDDNGSDA